MQRLEVSGAVRPIYGSLGVKWLIKHPQFLDILSALNVQHHTILLLRYDTVDYAPKHKNAETACRQSSSSSLNGISQNKTLCEAEQRRIYKCI